MNGTPVYQRISEGPRRLPSYGNGLPPEGSRGCTPGTWFPEDEAASLIERADLANISARTDSAAPILRLIRERDGAFQTAAEATRQRDKARADRDVSLSVFIALVKRSRRQIEQSPGVGVDTQAYGIAVTDEILSALDDLTTTPRRDETRGET